MSGTTTSGSMSANAHSSCRSFPLIRRRGCFSNRDPAIVFLLYDPFILRHKIDPCFAAFCRKVGLPVPGEVRQQI